MIDTVWKSMETYQIALPHHVNWHWLIQPLGSLPGLTAVAATDADVQEALNGMAIQDDGSTKLDYFVQAYRAGDFPFYADYAVHRATEELAGPRQIVVTK